MSSETVDASRSAVLLLDFTEGIVDTYATHGRAAAANALELSTVARKAGVLNLFVIPGHIDRDGAPVLKTGEPLDTLRPQSGDRLFHKTGLSAFNASGLDALLRREGRDTLIVSGIATSGTVLSTTRSGADLGYRMLVVEDACSDPEEDVHVLLTKRIHEKSWIGLWRVAEIVSTHGILDPLR